MSFRDLPSVDRLAAQLEGPRALAVRAAREVIAESRAQLATGGAGGLGDLTGRAQVRLRRLQASLRPVHNATGVIIHTNLGRAPLATVARRAVERMAEGYASLEMDLDSGERGARQAHVSELLAQLTGAPAALVVNNGAGAALLAVAALAGRGGSVVVSRGQLVEIGGGFRIPEVIEQAGARLIEVGTTNRTRVADYERALRALEGDTSVVLRVHPSNFRAVGFVEEVEIEALCELGVPVVDDLGSGALARELELLRDEPDVRRSVRAGVGLACFSGDKLLGGPQAGILVGNHEAIGRAERHPLARALRIDKLSLAALQATLSLYLDPRQAMQEIPVLAMLAATAEQLQSKAEQMQGRLGERARIVPGRARVGGGALPLVELHGPVVAVDPSPASAQELAARLRSQEVPVIARIQQDHLVLDPRTLSEAEAPEVGEAVRRALSE
ncbi:MAG TPA: L-seryl-tRNA(Sec) selenium transferase [Solirubrobacteraceae bacterium]|nr:L-seryl-tRNA(Sec) selenium transferase [Solirubrobacteraceae bacterium]